MASSSPAIPREGEDTTENESKSPPFNERLGAFTGGLTKKVVIIGRIRPEFR